MVFLQETKLDSFNLKEARKLWGSDKFELVVSPVIGPSRCKRRWDLWKPSWHQKYRTHASNKEFLTQLFPPSYGMKSDIDVFGSEFVELMAIYIGINLVLEANWVGQQALEGSIRCKSGP
ncbi:hypothetical protein V6N13_126557 [Hibiscus sabdariffa]